MRLNGGNGSRARRDACMCVVLDVVFGGWVWGDFWVGSLTEVGGYRTIKRTG